MAPVASELVGELLTSGRQASVLRELIVDYSRGARVLCSALQKHPACFTLLSAPRGGFFAWIRLPDGLTAQALLPVAERHGVVFLPGDVCAPNDPAAAAHYIRLCFAYEEAEMIEEGVRRLAAAVEELRGRSGVPRSCN